MDFGRTPDEIENERKRLLIYAFVVFGSVFLFVFGIASFVQDRLVLGSVLFLFLSIALYTARITKKTNRVQSVALYLASILFILTSFLLLSGGANGTGIYWTYSSIVFMILLSGPKAGSVLVVLYLAIISLFIYGPFTFPYNYPDMDSMRIIISSFALSGLVLASEWIRVGSYGAISEASENNRHLANTDPLTGLLNRHGLRIALEGKSNYKCGIVAILDIDKFKRINDEFGHAAGDMILRNLACLLIDNTKGGDLSARWGGEEFLLILYDTDINSAEMLLNRIRKDFESAQFEFNQISVSSSFSAGLAELTAPSTFELATAIADRRLYKAKNTGRNRIITLD